ncbi:MAG TPA: glycosyltransferase, partial [Chloroflexota bacterium]|nr:glycosyltransferase [Chloroflexota bacterium]
YSTPFCRGRLIKPVLEGLGWLAGTVLLWRVPRCQGDGVGPERASVVIPARDEEGNLARLLASLAAQDPPPGEVVVADDHSSDGTAAVARRWGATVVTCPPLPAGWTGKTWACWTGAEAATGDPLVFLDADTELAPGGLGRVVTEHRRRGGLVSVQPFHVAVRPYEALSAYFNVVAMMGVEGFTPLRSHRPAGAFGPCLVCSRADYLAAGGHRAVAAEVVEDVALARRFTGAGLPVTCLGGAGTIRFRMYGEGLGQLVEGWTKNFAAGAGSTRLLTLALVSAWIAGSASAAWQVVAVLGRERPRRSPAAAAYLAFAVQLRWMLRRIGRFGWWPAVLYPLPLAFFNAVFARSLLQTYLRGRVRWRGRVVPVRPVR